MRNSPAHFQTAVDKARCSWKADSVFTSGFGAEVEGTKREYALSRDWSWDACGRAILKKNEREFFSEGVPFLLGFKVLLAEAYFLKTSKLCSGFFLVTRGWL